MRIHPAALAPFLSVLLAAPAVGSTCDGLWHDGPRDRDVPVRITLPDGSGPVPTVIWSPGLGGGLGNAARWVQAWVAAGIAVVRVQHPGSDGAVYAGNPVGADRVARVRAGTALAQQMARIADVGFVADELARRPREGACPLTRIDRQRLGLAGHSMGGWVVQAMAGQRDGSGDTPAIDRRFRAFIAMSSTGAADPATAAYQFGAIGRPLLVITGTRDGVPAGAPPEVASREIAQRSAPFTGAPADGRKALLVVGNADHMLFAGDLRREGAEVAMQDRVIAVSTLWWRRWLLGEEGVEAALTRPALPAGDVWERK